MGGKRLPAEGRRMTHALHPLQPVWYATFHRVSPGAAGDWASGIRRQARAHPRFEKREIPGRHRRQPWTDARPPEDGRPVVVEICEWPLHRDLPRFNAIQTGTSPQVPHCVHARRIRARRPWNCNAQPTHLDLQRLVRKTAATHVPGVGGDGATGAHHSCHFGNAPGWVWNEEDDQRHHRRVERVVGERQCHRIALTKLCDT